MSYTVPIKLNDSLREALEYNSVESYIPAYGGESAALDLYHAGQNTITANVGDIAIIPTGLRIALDTKHVGLLRERGSAIKTGSALVAGVIDSGYTDEIFVALRAVSKSITVNPYQKLPVQLLVVPVINNYVEFTPSEWDQVVSSSFRKGGKIGSSD